MWRLALVKLACMCPFVAFGLQPLHQPASVAAASKSEEAFYRKTVWIVSQMRSSSTTLLSLISATTSDNTKGGNVFSLYEPCHKKDTYSADMQKLLDEDMNHCAELVRQFSRCNFLRVQDLYGWKDPHTTNNGTVEFSQDVAADMCKQSKMIAVKTVRLLRLKKVLWTLNANPNLKIIELIRDPRAIYTSFKHLREDGDPNADFGAFDLKTSCRRFAENSEIQHDRLHRVVYDNLVADPTKVGQGIYEFLNLTWGPQQDKWVSSTFNNKDCHAVSKWHPDDEDRTMNSLGKHFADCRSDSLSTLTAWKESMDDSERKLFDEDANCVRVARTYGFKVDSLLPIA